jgi:hypothetical protein
MADIEVQFRQDMAAAFTALKGDPVKLSDLHVEFSDPGYGDPVDPTFHDDLEDFPNNEIVRPDAVMSFIQADIKKVGNGTCREITVQLVFRVRTGIRDFKVTKDFGSMRTMLLYAACAPVGFEFLKEGPTGRVSGTGEEIRTFVQDIFFFHEGVY